MDIEINRSGLSVSIIKVLSSGVKTIEFVFQFDSQLCAISSFFFRYLHFQHCQNLGKYKPVRSNSTVQCSTLRKPILHNSKKLTSAPHQYITENRKVHQNSTGAGTVPQYRTGAGTVQQNKMVLKKFVENRWGHSSDTRQVILKRL